MRKVAIVRRNGLGDLLCAFPLIAYLRAEVPQTQITLFVDESNALLLPYLPKVEEVVVFKKGKNKYLHLLQKALQYRHKKFDLAISAKTSPMQLMNVFLFALGAKKRAAYVDQRWSSKLINMPMEYEVQKMRGVHQALKTLRLVNPQLQAVPAAYYPRIDVPCQPAGPLRLLLSASTTRSSSRFDVLRYAQLVNRLGDEGVSFVVDLLGLPGDRLRAQAIASELKVPYQIHFPQSFSEFMSLVGRSDLVFCGDGGVGHIGAAMGKKMVVLFGETKPKEWGPLGPYVTTFYDPIHVNRLSDESIYQVLKTYADELQVLVHV